MTISLKRKFSVIAIFLLGAVFMTQAIADDTFDKRRAKNPYLVRTFWEDGKEIDEIIVPGRPPKDFRAPKAEIPEPDPASGINTLPDVPAFDWCYGCSATSAAMMAGYYDRTGYSNMYAGPTNGGVCPLTNAVWDLGECPLSATHQGKDGLGVKGHADDYWSSYGSTIDPYLGNWTEHAYADCTADFMGTNQYQNWQNTDGSTTFFNYPSGAPLYDYSACEPGQRDGCHGVCLFVESRGYTVPYHGNFNQYILGWEGNTLGFTYDQFKSEIDAGRPVLIHVEGHTMLGYGYNTTGSLIYIHDTWDHDNHSMTWGGTYPYWTGSEWVYLQHYAVTVLRLDAAAPPPTPTPTSAPPTPTPTSTPPPATPTPTSAPPTPTSHSTSPPATLTPTNAPPTPTPTPTSAPPTPSPTPVPTTSPTPTPAAPLWICDYNGDGTSDIAIFRGSSGLWAIRGITRVYFGSFSDLPVPGDYSGNGTTDIGIFRNSSGLWAIRGVMRLYFGSSSDAAVPGDYNGDGSCDAAIFRNTSGLWAIRGVTRVYFGGWGDIPVPGYYDGSGTKDIALFRRSSGLWAIQGITRTYFGGFTDETVPGDYDGDGTWTPGIFRPSSGLWAIRGVTRAYFGSSFDQPLPADYTGNSRDVIGIFRDSTGLWAVAGTTRVYYGTNGDVPVTR